MKITNVEVYGLERVKKTARYPKVADVEEYLTYYDENENEKAIKNLYNLAKTAPGTGHDQSLTGITVYFDLTASIQFWPEFQRYTFANFISSTSKMHKLHVMNIEQCCNKYVVPETIKLCENLKEMYNDHVKAYKEGLIPKEDLDEAFFKLIYNIPQGFEYTAGLITNYRQLKTIYGQRRHHRLKEWQIFCDWIESLPQSELITGFYNKSRDSK